MEKRWLVTTQNHLSPISNQSKAILCRAVSLPLGLRKQGHTKKWLMPPLRSPARTPQYLRNLGPISRCFVWRSYSNLPRSGRRSNQATHQCGHPQPYTHWRRAARGQIHGVPPYPIQLIDPPQTQKRQLGIGRDGDSSRNETMAPTHILMTSSKDRESAGNKEGRPRKCWQ